MRRPIFLLVLGFACLGVASPALAQRRRPPATEPAPRKVVKTTDAQQRAVAAKARRRAAELQKRLKYTARQRRAAAALEKRASAEARAALQQMGELLVSSAARAVKLEKKLTITAAMKRELVPPIRAIGSRGAEAIATASMERAVAMMQRDLEDMAAELVAINDIKALLRRDIVTLRRRMANWPARGSVEVVWHDAKGKAHTKRLKTKAEAQQLLGELERRLAGLGDDSELRLVALQSALNRKTRAVTMLSGIVTGWHDTARTIIRNLK
jgi:hypothetical protein